MDLKTACFSFFDQFLDQKKPILLALSGGADSVCLLHLLLEWRALHPIEFHLVHVDHGWRKESAVECQKLLHLSQQLGLPFHTTQLDPTGYQGNLEEESRRERLAFFEKVQKSVQAQGILLAHHAGDVAETVFKRVLEGANLVSLAAMWPKKYIESLCLLRPLLHVSKAQIIAYLQAKGLSNFEDPTNADPRFLRGRMRVAIFPYLRREFGKAFEQNLCYLANDAQELCRYLDKALEPYLKAIKRGPFGTLVDLLPNDPFELKTFIKKIAPILHREQVTTLCKLLDSRIANKCIKTKEWLFVADRGVLCIVPVGRFTLPPAQKLIFGAQRFGPYTITVSDCTEPCQIKNHWKELFLGQSVALVPAGQYEISPVFPQMKRKILKKSDKNTSQILSKFFNKGKVPNFLVGQIPLLVQDHLVVEDFVTGTAVEIENTKKFLITIGVAESHKGLF